MACNCSKEHYNFDKAQYLDFNHLYSHIIEPFDSCPYCATKHIGYALVLFDEVKDKSRYIAQVYLCYKHLEKTYKEEAKKCFDLILDFLRDEIDKEKIKEVVKIVHDLTSKKVKNIDKEENLYLENNLDEYFRSALYILAAGELFSYEFGYKDVNIPYIIGLLQKAAEIPDEGLKYRLRELWKNIEIDQLKDDKIFYFVASNVFSIRKNELKKI